MFHCNRATRTFPVQAAMLLCAALVTDVAIAAPPTLQSVAVTPTAASISVGQTLFFKATGTFSNGTTQTLGPEISDIAPGWIATCVLLTQRGVKCWGENQSGKLGDGSTDEFSLTPRRVKGITDAIALTFRGDTGCALLAQGTVKCWGDNDYGQLGNGTTIDSNVPVAVTGINSATAVAGSRGQTCALLADGTVECWGLNEYGELGDGTNTSSNVPVSVLGIQTATAVAADGGHACALLASGAVQCWGRNDFGQLGNGTTIDSNTPVTVAGIFSATAITAGGYVTCALLASGAVKCWGEGIRGELGDGLSTQSSVPVSVAGISTAIAITAGSNHACAILSSGAAQCWGWNYYGQLGNGQSATQSSTPVRVSGISAPVRLAAGAEHTCALLSDGAIRCWGWNVYGELGNRRRTDFSPNPWPVNVIGTPGVRWRSSDPSKATILGSGRATGRSSGNTTITATTAGSINDNAVLTVK
jgi:alpha-tubulin suppressor-like RCC1 family protein